MSIFKGGTGGVLSGLVGNVVIVNNNGTMYLRKAPREREFSEKQKLNWQRFSAVTAFWKKFNNTPVQQIWKLAVEGKRGINLFIKVNSPAFGPDGELTDLDRLHFSAGKLPLPHRLMAGRSVGDPGKIEVTWLYNPESEHSSPTDEMMMMIAREGIFTGPIATGAIRKQEAAVIPLPSGNGTIQAIYLFFASDKRKLYSPDQYFGI